MMTNKPDLPIIISRYGAVLTEILNHANECDKIGLRIKPSWVIGQILHAKEMIAKEYGEGAIEQEEKGKIVTIKLPLSAFRRLKSRADQCDLTPSNYVLYVIKQLLA